MSYDVDFADRIRSVLHGQDGVIEKRMFGGLAFLVNGNMALCASAKGGLLLRVAQGMTDSLVHEDGVSRCEMKQRVIDGWVRVDQSATASIEELTRWVRLGLVHAQALPPK